METFDKTILFFIYSITSFIFVAFIYKKIKKSHRIEIIDFFNIYYMIVYFLVPIFSLYNNSNQFVIKYLPFFSYNIMYHIISYFMALVFYLLLNISYKIIKVNNKVGKEINIKSSRFLFFNFMFSVIGIIAYFLWSKIYGFPFGILKYADALRDNKIIINNPYTVFQPLCSFTIFASYMWLVLIGQSEKKLNKIICGILFVLTFFFSILSTLATDSRMSIITLFLVPIIYLINKKELRIDQIIVWGVISIVLLGNLDNITYYIRNNSFNPNYNNNNNNIFILLSNEFGFTYSNRINIIENIKNNNVKITELQDIKNILLFFVPKSMKPADCISLGQYNTSLYANHSGVIPTDIVTASIYKGRFVALIVLPILLATLLKFLDVFLKNKKNEFHKMMFYVIGVTIMLRFVAYYDLSEILSGRIALIFYYFIIYYFVGGVEKNEDF